MNENETEGSYMFNELGVKRNERLLWSFLEGAAN